MEGLKEFTIKFSGLKLGKHQFDYQLGKAFFEEFDYSEFEDADLRATVFMEKKTTALEFEFKLHGTIQVPCDLTAELFPLEISNAMALLVKFGEDFNDELEEILVIPHGEHQLNIAQYLYELAILSVPLKRIHPDVVAGKKGKEILMRLEALSPEMNKPTDSSEETDPRWDKLKSLLN